MSALDENENGHEPSPKEATPDWVPSGCSVLADGEYDAIILGTGLKECIISGLLSTNGLKVLQVDRNNYYGSEGASLNLTSLYSKFQAGEVDKYLGANRDYNVDLVPKFIMACGNLTKVLLHTKVTKYLEFKSCDGSFVYNKSGKVLKVPATPDEAVRSSLMGMFEKRRFRNFLIYISKWDEKDASTWKDLDLRKMTMRELYVHWGLVEDTHLFISHAMCLEVTDAHLDMPAIETVKNLQIYCYSLERYGKSPYIYPMYGLGGLPEGFSRLCAIHGGTFMLNREVNEILFDDEGAAWGIKCGEEVAKATMVIGEPSYFPKEKVVSTGKVVRSICFLNHPIPNTNNSDSAQIIIPGVTVGRKNDIFVCMVSSAHSVAANGIYIAIVSTKCETNDPGREIMPGLQLLGSILKRFDCVAETYKPVDDGLSDRCFISESFDSLSHFEKDVDDVLSLYERITGEALDMTINADTVEGDY